MKKGLSRIIFLLFFCFALTFLSGCSLGKPEGGFYKSTDSGNSFEDFSGDEEEVNLIGKNIISLEVDKGIPGQVFAGTESSGLYLTRDGGETWLKDNSGFNRVTEIKKTSSGKVIYIAAIRGGRGKVLKSGDEGENWEEIYTEKNEGSFVTALAVAPGNDEVIYISNTKGGIFKTVDEGSSWKNLEWIDGYVRKFEFDKINSEVMYLATNSSGLLKTENRGEEFDKILEKNNIYNVVASPEGEGVVYASTPDGLQRSNDRGENWEIINTLTKPEELVSFGLAVNPARPSEIYYASGKAFYKSTNRGDTWTPIQFDINTSLDIIQPDSGNPSTLYLGTRSRGSGFNLLPPMN
ncbi:MAG: hypothetical protein U5L10_05570 [Candidatus Moranbacteria bacterium]|nr:hypothetical protein [Candidatus Moranbacteria bacterium]